jgi:V/A-type H+-transporting ATPase subunit I
LLVDTYGAARYRDLDPTMFAAAAFVLMFGMMFGDVGHGLLLATLSIAVGRFGRGRLAGYRKLWPLGVACGLSAGVFGLLYGEAFGPTELVPTLWLSPVDDPLRLLVAGIGVGALLLLCSYLFGTANRWREVGSRAALQSASGGAGLLVFLGGGGLTAGWWAERGAVELTGGLLVASGATLLMAGFVRQAGHGAAAITQAVVESADSVVRVAANIVSFAHLAAFGLTHAAIGSVVLDGASALWGGVLGSASAVALLILGNAVAFALEALVAGVQAMRLEYYELFSRVFSGEGHRFSPWTVSPVPMDGSPP